MVMNESLVTAILCQILPYRLCKYYNIYILINF